MSRQGAGGRIDGARPRGLRGCVHAFRGLPVEDPIQREHQVRGLLRFRTGIRNACSRHLVRLSSGGCDPRPAHRSRRFHVLQRGCPGQGGASSRRSRGPAYRGETRRCIDPGEHVQGVDPGRLHLDVHGVNPRDRSRRGASGDAAQGQAGRRSRSPITTVSRWLSRTRSGTRTSASPRSSDPGTRSRSCTSVPCPRV